MGYQTEDLIVHAIGSPSSVRGHVWVACSRYVCFESPRTTNAEPSVKTAERVNCMLCLSNPSPDDTEEYEPFEGDLPWR